MGVAYVANKSFPLVWKFRALAQCSNWSIRLKKHGFLATLPAARPTYWENIICSCVYLVNTWLRHNPSRFAGILGPCYNISNQTP